MVSSFVTIPGYSVTEEIYNGSRTVVYRGYRADEKPVAIKLLKNSYPTFSEIVQFRNQYTIAKNLNYPEIIQTYSLEPYHNCYALVMEEFGGISLKEWALKGKNILDLRAFLEIAIALCNTLDILYQERIIHKDIKPSNILINPETKQVKLIDFSIASLLPRESQTLINPNILEGTLAYISPEQTGRMNRGIDYRTDFYSLGITFYELLTGELPFQANDPMELVHSHIAKAAPLVHEINPQIPFVVSKIVNKLMAKNAEDRYQNALGIKSDIEKCLYQLKEIREIQNFEIGQRDVCDRFIISDKLYGRETEVSTLLQSFERVSFGATEMMLVAGFSGIGKTAVVNEVHKPIVRQYGYFIKGKYDQFNRNIPLSAFVQAFRDLMGQLLSEGDAQIQQWKSKILNAVGENGQVIIEVIPELSKIIGEQPPAVKLSGDAAQNRFNLLFQKFTQVFTSVEHPLVIFLDDLQWADSTSLKLMQLLMTDTGHLLLIGAYRDNEVNPAHPLMLTLGEIQKNQAAINTITLAPLSQEQVNQLVADTLKCTENLAWVLSQLVYQKTQGNPFFVTQFLKAIHQEDLIKFDFKLGCWQCDIAQVRTLAVTDDIVDFMAFQLRKLPQLTQQVLQLAACIGNQFDLTTLAIVSERSEVETAAALWKALQEGLIVPVSDVYKFYVGQDNQPVSQHNPQKVIYNFLHDRVQQASHSLIPDEQKQLMHLKIGQLLLSVMSKTEKEEKIFEIITHLNKGVGLITSEIERAKLANLNLAAAQKAKSATAYIAAIEYATKGIELLGKSCWQQYYDVTLALHDLAAEVACLCGEFKQMEQIVERVVQNAHQLLDKVKVYEVTILADVAQSKQPKAIKTALFVLELFEISFPEQPTDAEIHQSLQQAQDLLKGKDLQDLLALPEMIDLQALAVMRILGTVTAAVYQAIPKLLPLIVCKQVSLSIEYGNAAVSAQAYAWYGVILCDFGEIDLGNRVGQLAMELLSRFQNREFKASTINMVYPFVKPWKYHIQDSLAPLLDGYHSGLEMGTLEYAAYCAYNYCSLSFFLGKDLSFLEPEMKVYNQAIAQLKQEVAHNYLKIFYQSVLNLLGQSELPWEIQGVIYDESIMFPLHQKANDLYAMGTLYTNKLILCYLFNELEQAIQVAVDAKQYLSGISGCFMVPVFHFYHSLAYLAILPNAQSREYDALTGLRQSLPQEVISNQKKLKEWADHAPTNHLHKFYLVEAEQYRVLGQVYEAMDYYDRAIASAKENAYLQEEALANELAAKFYINLGKEKLAQAYMQEAYYCYACWGAKAKVADLEKRYWQLLAPILQSTRSPLSANETIFTLDSVTSTGFTTPHSSSVSGTLDLAAILKASQSISSEIELSKLLSSLLLIVIENAGADKCVLILSRDSHLSIEGSITVGTEPAVLQSFPVDHSQDIPLKLIYKVKHNKQTIVLFDATIDPTLANDPYIIRQQPQSILCSPILHQGQLKGILYLENNLATGVFTRNRVELLNLLCAQAAISLENAQLYEREQEKSQSLQASLEKLQKTEVSLAKEREFLNAIIHNITDGIVVCDANGALTLFNKATREFHGLPMESLPPEQWAEYFSLYQKDGQTPLSTTEIPLFRALKGEIVENAEMVIAPKQGSRRSLLASGQAIFDPWGNKVGAVVVMRDISDRKQAELALQQKSVELEQALHNLQNAQLQIIQSEKMSALGNLVAGVAHEMNNPLGFISASLLETKPTIAELIEHLKLYQKTFPNQSGEIIDHAEEIDLEYTLEDLPKIINSMSAACDRLKNISTSLRTFSRADRDYKVPFNIHEGIDSTILILKHRLKANDQRPAIEVITNYGNLPPVECFPGQLNQVFMNIVANAIDALDELNTGRTIAEIKAHPNRITIQTLMENERVKIVIADNGCGMTESVKEKIFDHLFTTKAVGKGTGLGLAITRQIVESAHGGKLICHSVVGQGSEFIIEIPIST